MGYILGVNCSGFHASACLVADGVVRHAICEERLSRVKQDKAFPVQAIRYCCDAAGIRFGDIEAAFVGWHPRHYLRQSDRSLLDALRARGKMSYLALNELATLTEAPLTDVAERLTAGGDTIDIRFVDHHVAHLDGAFYPSGFESADFLLLDGFGEMTTGRCGTVDRAGVSTLEEYPTPHSLGSFYSAFTDYLGFRADSDEWKVMALSALGDPAPYYDRVRSLLRVDGLRIELDLTYFEHFIFFKPGYFSRKLVELLGPPLGKGEEPGQRHCDIVAAVQRVAEETVFELLANLHAQTGGTRLVVGGGFFMNSVCNGKLHRATPYGDVFIGGSPDDSGIAIGSALHGANRVLGQASPVARSRHNSFGRAYTQDEIEAELTRRKLRFSVVEDPAATAADLLADGHIVGWFQGASEFGQRALGNRSILADPRRAEMKDLVNASVKYREGFRPFAPSILAEHQAKVMDVAPGVTSHFMERVFPFKEDWRARVPAVVHFDGSARPQTVEAETNPLYHALIEAFHTRTGVPLVLNTSFNVNGMPLVESPADALDCFYACGLDALLLGRCLLKK